MRKREKVAVSISRHVLAKIESMRKRDGDTRSAVFERALEAFIAEATGADEARRYVDAYRRRPERPDEEREALVTALQALATEPWDA